MNVTSAFFPSTFASHIYFAQQFGLFAKRDLDVTLVEVSSATQQMELWDEGVVSVMHTSPDHLFRPRRRDPIVLEAEAMGELSLFVASDADLQANALYAVDGPGSAYALVLRRLLDELGLPWSDESLVATGGTRERWSALRAGRVQGTLLHTPFRQEAERDGFRALAGHFAVVPGLTTAVVVAARDEASSPEITAYLEALREARSALREAEPDDIAKLLVAAGWDEHVVGPASSDVRDELGSLTPPDVNTGVNEAASLRSRYFPDWRPDRSVDQVLGHT